MSNTTSPPTSRRSSTRSPTATSPGRTCCAISGGNSPADVDETRTFASREVLEALNELLGAAHLSGARRRRRSAPVPELRHRQAVAEARQVRRLRRLLELSRVPLHAPARGCRRERQWRGCRRRTARRLGKDPETGLDVTLRTGRFGPYVQLGEANGDGEKPKRASLPKGWEPQTHRSRAGACASGAAARGRPPSGNAASRSPPASAATARSSCTTAPSPISTRSRRSSTVGLNRAVSLLAEKKSRAAAARRHAGRAQGARRPSRRRRRHGARRPLRTLCESRQGQCDAAEGHRPGRRDAGDALR